MTAATITEAAALIRAVTDMLAPVQERQADHSAALRCEAPRVGDHGVQICDADNVQATLAGACELLRNAATWLDSLDGARGVLR